MSSSSTSSLGISGLISGIDTNSIVQKLIAVDKQPITALQNQQTALLNQSDALTAIGTSLKALSADAQTLSDPQLFQTEAATLTNPSVGTATVDSTQPGIVNGTYTINILQLSTQSKLVGAKATPTSGTGAFNPAVSINSAVGSGGLGSNVFDSTTNNAVFTIGIGNGDTATFTVSSSGVSYKGTVGGNAVSGSTGSDSLNDVVNEVNAAFGTTVMHYVAAGSGGPKVYLDSTGEGSTNGGSITLSTQSGSLLQSLQLFNAPSQQSLTLPAATSSTTTLSSLFGGEPSGGYTFSVNGTQINLAVGATIGDLTTALNNAATTTGVRATLATDNSTGTPKIVLLSTNNSPISISDVQGGLVSSMQLSSLTPYTGAGAKVNIDNPTLIGTRDPSAAIGIAGTLTINGVSVAYASTDSLQTVLNNITGSTAGVVATYDSYSDQITLTSKSSGDAAINLSDSVGTGGFLDEYGLSSTDKPTFTAGSPTVFTVNGGSTRVSEDATLSSADLGVNGLTFNASSVGSTSVTIAPDVTTIAADINKLITDYNSTQSLIASDVLVNTSDPTKNGPLANDSSTTQLPAMLRLLLGSAVNDPTNSSYTYRSLADLGIQGNASNNTFTQVDTTKLTDALTNHLSDIKTMFTNLVPGSPYPALGIAQSIDNYVNAYATGPNSVINFRENDINTQVQQMNTQIATINAQVSAEQTALQAEFGNYESALAVNKSYQSYFSGTSSINSSTPYLSGSTNTSSSSTSSSSTSG
jgi:flagellar hook-associated protein 2